MIRLEPVNSENWRLGLKVSETQKKHVSDSMTLLARAYAYRHHRSNVLVIYRDNTPIGMALYYDCEEINAFDLSQFFIDESFQHNGFGSSAAKLVLDMMKADGKYNKVSLCFIEGNIAAQKMYEKLGFNLTGERDGNEIIMQKIL